MNEPQSRFADVWTDAMAAEAAGLQRRQVERGYRRVLALTDDVLGKLERRNLDGQPDLDEVIRREISRTLRELPPDARGRFPAAETVQEALDGIFAVQATILAVLQRMLHWDRLLTSPWDGEVEAADDGPVRRTA